MSDRPKFTIVTVCKNPGKTLLTAIETLESQLYRDFEWIVVDGQSTDGTAQMLEQNRHLIARYISEADQGIYDAMNKGIALSSGEFIYFLNCGDSFYDENVLMKISQSIDDTACDLIFGDSCLVDPDNGTSSIKHHSWVDKYYLFNRPVNHQAIFSKKSVFGKVGLFDTSYVMKADHDWIVKCLMADVKFCHIPITVSNYVLKGFAYQNRSKFRSKEKKRIQNKYFKPIGRTVVRGLNYVGVNPPAFFRAFLNKIL